ncbi:hypothetical protein [Afipia sp. 1NLS2]|jgi:hypothetical protein|uniref:hypothetical protein n=1 Tax=Afipia sp. 1NLS2 TaxID=666684 RepID=UPI0001D9F153|nr:hypothetical protein [Afipia sp. 1NLS2]EFI50281.1 conserved hypothetical protein [Afipia sp. 1NLS2]
MKGFEPVVPENVRRFEICLYASLLLDTLSFPLRPIPEDVPQINVAASAIFSAGLILLFCHLVWVAAHQRRNWARLVLMVSLGLSILTLTSVLRHDGWSLASMIDICSAVLTALGIYQSFTGDAEGWFQS